MDHLIIQNNNRDVKKFLMVRADFIKMLEFIMDCISIIVPLLIAVAYVTLAERKVLGSMQLRKGPNVVGWYGLLQPLADGLKLFAKETIKPTHASLVIFIVSPIWGLTLALVTFGVIPWGNGIVMSDINLGILYIMALSSLSVYAILMSGWSSNSRYAFYGAVRAAAQMISYEVSMGLIIISVIICTGSFNLTDIVENQIDLWHIVPLWPAAIMFFVSGLAETNRTPFDLTEGESELVSGYNVEYSAMTFALFFLAEYAHIIFVSILFTILFLGGWYLPGLDLINFPSSWLPYLYPTILGFKTSLIIFLFVCVRGTLPRFRMDQVMMLCWKSYLPLSLAWVIYTATTLL